MPSDLFETLGKKSSGQAAGKTPDADSTALIGKDGLPDTGKRGDNLIQKAANTGITEEKPTENPTPEPEVKLDEKTVKDPDSWSKESALKEMVKLREENRVTRLKYQEQMEKIRLENETKLQELAKQNEEALEAKRKLEALEAEKADKQRDLSERVAHRDSIIAKLEADKKALELQAQKRLAELESKLSSYEAEREAQLQVYRERVQEELKSVPEKFRKFAETLVKSQSDPQEAWAILSEAKVQGMFEDKQIVVNHAVPGAKDGARASKEKMEAAAKEAADRMTPGQKVKAGLDAIRRGEKNDVFRNK